MRRQPSVGSPRHHVSGRGRQGGLQSYQGANDIALSLPLQASEADDLASAQLERDGGLSRRRGEIRDVEGRRISRGATARAGNRLPSSRPTMSVTRPSSSSRAAVGCVATWRPSFSTVVVSHRRRFRAACGLRCRK